MGKTEDDQRNWAGGVDRTTRSTFAILSVLVLVTLLCAVTGPFNTFLRGTFSDRLLYWGVAIALSWQVARVAIAMSERVETRSVFVRELVSNVVFVPIYAPILIAWTNIAFPVELDGNLTSWQIAAYVAGISISISVLRYALPHLNLPQLSSRSDLDTVTDPAPRLLRRLPDAAGQDVLRLSGGGHYVNVFTSSGQFDLRMRLSDAIAEMDGVDGYSIHRSHWVSREAVARSEQNKGRPILVLVNGDELPVGAKYQPDLEAAGLLDARGMGTASA